MISQLVARNELLEKTITELNAREEAAKKEAGEARAREESLSRRLTALEASLGAVAPDVAAVLPMVLEKASKAASKKR